MNTKQKIYVVTVQVPLRIGFQNEEDTTVTGNLTVQVHADSLDHAKIRAIKMVNKPGVRATKVEEISAEMAAILGDVIR